MTRTNAISAFGTTLSWNGHAIAELNTITGPQGMTMETADVTTHDNPSRFREFIATLANPGTIDIQGNFYPGDTDGQIAMVADWKAGTARTVILASSTSGAFTWTATAIITDMSFDNPQDNAYGFSATLQVSGEPILAVSASGNLTALTGIEENTGAALTFTPAFSGATKEYNVTVNTASTWVKFTPTKAGATITISNGTSSQDVASGAQSGTISITDAAITNITLSVKETGKVANKYKIHVYCP